MKSALQPARRNPYAKPAPPDLSIFARRSRAEIGAVTPFRISTCESVSKQRTLTTFRMNTYAKQGEGGRYSLRNPHNPMLAEGVAAGGLLQLAESLHAPARQKRQEAQLPRLQGLIRVKKIFQKPLVLGQQAAFLIQRPARLAPQLFQLEANLVSRRTHRASQRRVQLLDLRAQLSQRALRQRLIPIEILGQRGRHRNGLHLPPQLLRASPKVLDA